MLRVFQRDYECAHQYKNCGRKNQEQGWSAALSRDARHSAPCSCTCTANAMRMQCIRTCTCACACDALCNAMRLRCDAMRCTCTCKLHMRGNNHAGVTGTVPTAPVHFPISANEASLSFNFKDNPCHLFRIFFLLDPSPHG